MLVHVDFAESYRNDQQNNFVNQTYLLSTSWCYFKGATSEIRNKSVVVMTKNSDHKRITSMNCLKVIDTVKTECVKSSTNAVLWSDGMGTQFRSRFIFEILAGTMFLNKSLCYLYDEGLHGKIPMADVGKTTKNVISQKVKSGQFVVHTRKEFPDATMKFVSSIISVNLAKSDKIVDQAPSIPETLSIHKFVPRINDRGDCSIIFQDGGRTGSLSHSMVQKS